MPDHRKHRGPHPEDARLFDPAAGALLREAARDLCWLFSRGYPHASALKLVGDRYELVARQRTAVSRCCCGEAAAARRRSCQRDAAELQGATLWVDGYNVLTTIEAALAGGVILAARDGVYRDMASMHGSYRKVAETVPALDMLGRVIAALGVAECRWFLDRPVSNSGRLKGILEAMAAARDWSWRADLVADPGIILADPMAGAAEPTPPPPRSTPAMEKAGELPGQPGIVVATADSAILDRCPAWFNLARETIVQRVPEAWVVDLSG